MNLSCLKIAVALLIMASAPSYADDVQKEDIKPDSNLAERLSDSEKAADLSFLKFATVVQPGEITKPGDIIKISREFLNWNLRCDVRLSTNRRACFVEQSAQSNESGLVWRIAMNDENRPISVISVPGDADMKKGIRMKFAGLEKVLDRDLFRCSANACIGGFYFEDFVQEAISSSPSIAFSFSRNQSDTIAIEMPMMGFSEALNAGARDPFGRDISQNVAKAAQTAKQEPSVKRAVTPKPVKPVAKNQKNNAKTAADLSAPKKSSGLY